ncbi:MAG: hypothetical protein ACOY6N_02570 [Pseudomonadota bacterium]|nr:hypothetical protein [Sulfuricystis thermophila]MDI6749655.1 hypothetical protein [Rhodocyclaceae bacterium]
MAEVKIGSETVASASKGKMTLFRDDRQEDWGAIVFSILIIAVIVLLTMK